MGGGSSKNHFDDEDDYEFLKRQKRLVGSISVPLQVMVSHYTPSTFPLVPIVNEKTTKTCRESWKKISTTEVTDPYGGPPTSGLAAFYSTFYDRLEQLDVNGKFDAILANHSGGQDKTAARGAILIRIIDFVLKIEGDSEKTQLALYMLGKSHSQKAIRPWMYSIFVQTLLNTISTRLGTDATSNVMEAWVNLFAFVMQSMLPASIKGQVVETEMNINTSTQFSDGRIAAEVGDIEEVKVVQKRLKGIARSSVGSQSQRSSFSQRSTSFLTTVREGERSIQPYVTSGNNLSGAVISKSTENSFRTLSTERSGTPSVAPSQ